MSLGIENDQYKEDLKKVLDTIKEKKLNVVCFPELMISDREQSYFCDILENQYLKNADQSLVVPFFLLICGSFHKKTTLNYKGQVPIIMYINGKAMPLSYYFKHEPFIIKFHSLLSPEERKKQKFRNLPDMTDARERTFLNEYAMEDIERDRGITIIEIENFGKFGVAVCKDVLPMGSIILERYGYLIDHLFILSLNFSDQADFALIASQLAKKKKISVAYVNAKGYDRSNKSPSFYQQMPDPRNDQLRRKQSLTSNNAPKKPIIIYQDANKDSIFFSIPRKKKASRGR